MQRHRKIWWSSKFPSDWNLIVGYLIGLSLFSAAVQIILILWSLSHDGWASKINTLEEELAKYVSRTLGIVAYSTLYQKFSTSLAFLSVSRYSNMLNIQNKWFLCSDQQIDVKILNKSFLCLRLFFTVAHCDYEISSCLLLKTTKERQKIDHNFITILL